MCLKPTLLASALLFASFNTQAALTSYNPNGVELVYSSISDVTWTKDANLFKALYDVDNTLISKIAAVTLSYNDPAHGLQTIDAGDFNTDTGRVTWWGALAFVDYLNSISYGGSDQWRLPTVANADFGYDTSNGTAAGAELSELFYQELGGTLGNPIPNTATFDNEQTYYHYWSDTEYALDPTYAWFFGTHQGYQDGYVKSYQFRAWAVSPGQVAAVPEADTVAMLLAGLGILGAVMRRRRI